MQGVWMSCGLLLVSAAIAPSALGHDDQYLCPNPYLLTFDTFECGYSGSEGYRYPTSFGTPDPLGVAGTYVGGFGPAYAPDAYNQPQNALATGINLWWWGQCDLEVAFDQLYLDYASAVPAFPNEAVIDGSSTPGSLDGTWDDGGHGVACHTRDYWTAAFNTPGCPGHHRDPHSAGGVNVNGGDIWLGAACDWKARWDAPGGTHFLGTCLLYGEYGLPWVDLDWLDRKVDLVMQCSVLYLECLFIPSCYLVEHEYCGSDGVVDAIDFGFGSGAFGAIANFPTVGTANVSPLFPPTPTQCLQAHATESIFVFDTIATVGGTYVDPDGTGSLGTFYVPDWTTTVNVYPALSGKVWTVTP